MNIDYLLYIVTTSKYVSLEDLLTINQARAIIHPPIINLV